MMSLGAKRWPRVLTIVLLVTTLAVGIAIGTLLSGRAVADRTPTSTDASELRIPSARDLATEFTQLAKQLEPSVVHIKTDYVSSLGDGEEEEGELDQFQRFFRGPNGAPSRPFKREAAGSGFIVDPKGYILTNHHVIENAEHIRVTLPHDSSELRAKLIGFDRETDVAVIKVEPRKPMQAVRLGNSDSVQVGDWAIAIGSPFGLEATVTAGIVSATGRDLDTALQFQKFIQTDAAINPGNSGGPLLNIRGEVVGINTAIATENGGYQGIGFALPMNLAVGVYNSIVKNGKVTRGSIGIGWDKRSQATTLKALGFQRGLLVERVEPEGPAAVAGVQQDDVILELNGKPINGGDDLVAIVASAPIGSEVSLTLDRSGQRIQKRVKVEDRSVVFKNDGRFQEPEAPKKPTAVEPAKSVFGISIRALSAARKSAAGIEGGVEITRVEPASFAEDVRLVEGDIIVSINRQPIRTPDDLKAIQAKLRAGDPVAFRVMRQDPANRAAGYIGLYRAGILPD